MNLKISIITVVLDGVRTIERTIKSVLAQTYPNIEYIIIDGGSTDGTTSIIEKYSARIDYWISESDNGLYDAMNKGIAIASGELIGIVNSDDWLENNAVKIIFEAYKNNPECDIFYGNLRWHYNGIQKIKYPLKLTKFNFFWRRIPIFHPATFVHRNMYSKYNYSEKYKIASDLHLFWRAFLDGSRFQYIPNIISNQQAGGLSSNEKILMKERILLRKEFTNVGIKIQLFIILTYIFSYRKWIKRLLKKYY